MMLTENWVNGVSVVIVMGSLARAWLVTRRRGAKHSSDAGLSVTPRLLSSGIHHYRSEIYGLNLPMEAARPVHTLRFEVGSERRAS